MPPRTARSRQRWLWAVVALAVGLLGYVGVTGTRRSAAAARLPALPDLGRETAAVRDHLLAADRTARAAPTSVPAVGALCLAYHADLFYDQATRCYAAVEALDAGEWKWTYYRALTHAARGEDQASAGALRRVTSQAREFSPAWWQLGEFTFKTGRLEDARDAWEHAMMLPEPPRPEPVAGEPARSPAASIAAYATLGIARLELAEGRADRAEALLADVTTRTPRFGPAFRLLSSVYTAQQRPDDARRALRQADRLPAIDPYIDPTYTLLARESRRATFLLQQASTIDISTEAAWREYLIRRALLWDPENVDAIYELSLVLRALKRFDEALTLLQDYSRRVPGDFTAVAGIGRCLAGLQRYAEAEGVLRRSLAGADDAATRYDLGVVLDRLNRVPEAVAEYERTLARNPNHRDALNNLGVDLARLNNLTGAASRFEQLVAADPENVEAHVNLGLVLAANGQAEAAETHFRQALTIDPQNARATAALQSSRRPPADQIR